VAGPIEQFEIKPLFSLGEVTGYQIVFTNSAAYLIAAASLGGLFLLAATVPAACAVARPVGAELIHEFIARTLCDNTGEAGMRFFPLVFSVFMFMLTANLLGMFPMPSRSPARSW
jgi:F-type H+-transporting ATPase subunit a